MVSRLTPAYSAASATFNQVFMSNLLGTIGRQRNAGPHALMPRDAIANGKSHQAAKWLARTMSIDAANRSVRDVRRFRGARCSNVRVARSAQIQWRTDETR